MKPSLPRTLPTCCLVALATCLAGCMPNGFLITPVSTRRELTETTLRSDSFFARSKIAIIDLDGVMTNARSSDLLGDGEHQVSLLLEKLERAEHDDRVKAVILRINSPGGTVTASELMHAEVQGFRRRSGKPVIAMMMDVAASGGYYVACACDEIVAHRSTVTGSIGVVLQLFEVTGTMAKLGVAGTTIKSGSHKAGGSPFEKMSDQDRAIFQGIIDALFDQFVAVVVAGRPDLDERAVRALADGRVYTAPQALEAGLIDSIANMRETVEAVKDRIGAANIRLVAYHRPLGYVPNYYARAHRPGHVGRGDINIFKIEAPSWLRNGGARFMYLWLP